jgi:nucleotidyl transferase
VASGDILFDESSNNIVKLPDGKFAVLNGLDGFIVAERDNVLLICKKENSSALIRKYVNEAQLKKGEEFI